MAHFTFVVNFVLRDRVDSRRIYASGRAVYKPTVRPENFFNEDRTNTVFTRLDLPIVAPPEWVLGRPGAELAIESIEKGVSTFAPTTTISGPVFFQVSA